VLRKFVQTVENAHHKKRTKIKTSVLVEQPKTACKPQGKKSQTPTSVTALSQRLKAWLVQQSNASNKLREIGFSMENVFSITVSTIHNYV
jgi:hypothetical protein